MKKSVIAVFAGLISAAAFAASPNDVVLAFSTQGPDTYSDGTQVKDGEYYAVVWTQTNAAFAGIDANGKAVGDENKVVLKAALAKDGKCPSIVFRLPADYEVDGTTIGALAENGTWGVYLLDTRKFDVDENGVIQDSVKSVGGSNAVNGYGLAGSAVNLGSAAASAVAAATASAAPAEASNLKIRDIRFVGNNVQITVTGSLSCLAYQLMSGTKPDKLSAPADGAAKYGKDDGELTIVTPKTSGTQFFQVNRK